MLNRTERGASLVEFAIVMPLVLMLVIGLVSAGIAYNEKLALTHAARETARFGATLPISNPVYPTNLNQWLDALAVRAVDDATGSLDPAAPGYSLCVAYVYPDGTGADDQTRKRVDTGGGPVFSAGTCFADGRPDEERRVQVQASQNTDFEALLFSTTVTLTSRATARFESSLGS